MLRATLSLSKGRRANPRQRAVWRLSPLLDQEQPILPPQRPPDLAVLVDDDVLFLRHPDRLVVPLRYRRGGLQLDREPHAGDDPGVAPSGHAVLIVPEPDQG